MTDDLNLLGAFDNPIAKNTTDGLISLIMRLGGAIKNRRQAAEALKKYKYTYDSRYGLLKLLGMPQGVSLESVYTPVKFLNELSIRLFESIEGLEELYRDSQRRRFQTGECRSEDGITVANKTQYLMVLGSPGSGKSTFLRRVGLEAFKDDSEKFKHDCIPVLLELKQFNTHSINVVGAIAEEFKHFGFPSSIDFATKALKEGKLLVLLDGLDEVPKEFNNSVMDAIDNLVTQYSQNRFIASCRIAAYRSNFKHDFQVIELADFDDQQIQQFINNWFSSELDKQSKTAEKCWDALNHENNKAAKELAQTPLLLTFICLVYDRKQSFPPNRSRLYNKALDILLEEWAAEKRVPREEIYQGLHTDLEKVMLAKISYEGFVNDQLFFQKEKLVNNIKKFLADTVDNLKYLDVDGKEILNDIAAQQGILVKRAEYIYSFSHLTLQEYLTAQYISQDYEYIEKLVTENLTDKRWREVFILVAGIKDNADKLLKLMETSTQQLIKDFNLRNLLVWAKQITNTSTGDIQPLGKRAIALANIYANAKANANASVNHVPDVYTILYTASYVNANPNPNAYAIAYANAKPNVAFYASGYPDDDVNSLTRLIEYLQWSAKFQIYRNSDYSKLIAQLRELIQKISAHKKSREDYKAFGQRIIQSLLKSFNLNLEIINLSKAQLEALDNYFYGNLLMIECKKAAVRVSQKTWNEIESRMLLPVPENS